MARATGNAAAHEAALMPVALALIAIVLLAVVGYSLAPHVLHLSHSVAHLKPSSPAGG